MLGVDLISLGLKRVLSVIDFQPLHPTAEYSEKYIDWLQPIRDKYPDLHGALSGKIYNDTSFFSKQMLFGRFPDEKKIRGEVYPAFAEYMDAYVEMANKAVPNFDQESMRMVASRQKAYDEYSALKDPAVMITSSHTRKIFFNTRNFEHCLLFHDFRSDFSIHISERNGLNHMCTNFCSTLVTGSH